MQNTKNTYAPFQVQRGNSTPNEAKTQRSIIEHSLTPILLEKRLNSWYDAKEARQQQCLAQAQANPDQQYIYVSEEDGYKYTYQVTITLLSTVEIQPTSLVNPLELDSQIDNEASNALELHELADLESEVCIYEC